MPTSKGYTRKECKCTRSKPYMGPITILGQTKKICPRCKQPYIKVLYSSLDKLSWLLTPAIPIRHLLRLFPLTFHSLQQVNYLPITGKIPLFYPFIKH